MINRAVDLLTAFTQGPGTVLSLAELARRTGLPKPTLHRMLQQLEGAGWLQREGGGRHYGTGVRLRRLAEQLLLNDTAHGARHAVLRRLVEELGESCNITSLSGGEVVYLDRVETAAPLRFYLHPGSRVPAHCSASGKLFLAEMAPAQRRRLLAHAPLEAYTQRTVTETGHNMFCPGTTNLADGRLLDQVLRVLAEEELTPDQLQLELTERAVIGSDNQPMAELQALAACGVGIAIDDFGTGYSSLSYLTTLPISELKIDRSFVRDLGLTPASKAIVMAIISLARALGLRVVAEGVESLRQMEALHKEGCWLMQGYLFSRPQPAEDIEAWLLQTVLPRKAPWIGKVGEADLSDALRPAAPRAKPAG